MLNPSLERRIDVLHVEDDDSWGRLVKLWLLERGLTVKRVRTGWEMRLYLSGCRFLPRCLLLDLNLSDGDGLTQCDYVKTSPRLQSLPIVILTARDIPAADVLKHKALYRVEKGRNTEGELPAAILSILTQGERDRGVIDVGDLHLDPHENTVFLEGKEAARLPHGPFAALSLLARNSPSPVQDHALYTAFLTRHPYHTADHELAVQQVLRNNISTLRRLLGKELGGRIDRAEAGYYYIPHGVQPNVLETISRRPQK